MKETFWRVHCGTSSEERVCCVAQGSAHFWSTFVHCIAQGGLAGLPQGGARLPTVLSQTETSMSQTRTSVSQTRTSIKAERVPHSTEVRTHRGPHRSGRTEVRTHRGPDAQRSTHAQRSGRATGGFVGGTREGGRVLLRSICMTVCRVRPCPMLLPANSSRVLRFSRSKEVHPPPFGRCCIPSNSTAGPGRDAALMADKAPYG